LVVLEQKKDHAESLDKILDATKDKLSQDKLDMRSAEKIAEAIEKALVEREKDLLVAEKNIAGLKQKMYKNSLKLAEFRKKEAELISDIHGVHANIKNFSSKVSELESKRSRQEELLYNANFQLQQMEKKVSRGLGERSNEEQQKLSARIDELEKEVASEKQKKTLLVQQHRKLQAELRAWNKKHELTEAKYKETVRKIDDIDLEIYASEKSLKETVSKREEAMVSHDVTLLDVRRLRDALRDVLEEILALKQQASESRSSMHDKKDEARSRVEINIGQLRSRKEECHKTAIDVGRLKIALEKIESKYNTIRSINNAGKESGDYQSPELKLILAAQKRQELQEEGDKLDETIRKKEMEIRTMKKTLVQLRERNTNFRSSFARADMNGAKAQELKRLEAEAEGSEEALFRVRKEVQVLQKCTTENRVKLERLSKELAICETQSQDLRRIKEQYDIELQKYNATLDTYSDKVSALQKASNQNKTGQELQLKKFKAELVHIQSDRICKLLVGLSNEFVELREDIIVDMEKEGLLET
jgi:chromosome segregation ATPase